MCAVAFDLSSSLVEHAGVRLLSVPVGLLVLTAATSCTTRACTEIGAASGVQFDFSTLPAAGAPWQVTACVQDVCDTRTVQQADVPSLFVHDDALEEGAAVPARLRVVDAAGVTVVDDTTSVTLSRYQPNGEGCEPIVWQAETIVGADGALQQVEASS
ncbi:hypothetical protein [Kineococcus arenarius]|uniref:hypothetical protein n=1 Tax=unclassified Kineococcus TaxID=2621656 RepID=UPI003D7D4CB2